MTGAREHWRVAWQEARSGLRQPCCADDVMQERANACLLARDGGAPAHPAPPNGYLAPDELDALADPW